MKKHINSVLSLLLVSIGMISMPSQAVAAEEWVEINVIVNVVDGSDSSKLDDILKKANAILKKARIKLKVKKTTKNVNVGNGDPNMTKSEGDDAVKAGQTELKNTFKDKKGDWTGKGIKIYLADDVWSESPSTNGWSIHRKPVVVVETNSDPNQMGNILAHELIHVLTVVNHSTDPNNVMFPSTPRGTNIDPNQITEITPKAKKRGKAYTINPPALPGKSVKTPASGRNRSIDRYGAALDDLNDHFSSSPFDPFDPQFFFADIREVTIFSDEPSLLTNNQVLLEISFEGLFPLDPTSSMQLVAAFEQVDPVLGLKPIGQLQIFGSPFDPISMQTQWFNPDGSIIPMPPPQLHENERFDGLVPLPQFSSLEQPIPIELVQMDLLGIDPIIITLQTEFMIPLLWPDPIFDDVLPFTFELTPIEPEVPLLTFMRGDAQLGGSAGDVLVLGCGFTPLRPVEVNLNGATLQVEIAGNDGLVISNIGSSGPGGVSVGLNEVELRETTDPFVSGFSFFAYCDVPGDFSTDLDGDGIADVFWTCEPSCPRADQDDDCDVDFVDLSFFASQWMHGVP